jgi:hypothetical protein
MSGPIVRRYGFPNFDKIFGEREVKHGIDEEAAADRIADEAKVDSGGSPGVSASTSPEPKADRPGRRSKPA